MKSSILRLKLPFKVAQTIDLYRGKEVYSLGNRSYLHNFCKCVIYYNHSYVFFSGYLYCTQQIFLLKWVEQLNVDVPCTYVMQSLSEKIVICYCVPMNKDSVIVQKAVRVGDSRLYRNGKFQKHRKWQKMNCTLN